MSVINVRTGSSSGSSVSCQPALFPQSIDEENHFKERTSVIVSKVTMPVNSGFSIRYRLEGRPIDIGKWKLQFKTTPLLTSFQLRLLQSVISTNWSLTAHAMISICKKGDLNSNGIERSFRNFIFNKKNTTLAFDIPFDEYAKMFDDTVNTERTEVWVYMDIFVVSTTGQRSRRQVHFDLTKRAENSSFMFAFSESENIYVNLEYLSELSHYCADLLQRLPAFPKDQTTNLPFEKLEDVNYNEFHELIRFAYPHKININYPNHLLYLLKLAKRFQFDGILIEMEKSLCDAQWQPLDLITKLKLSFEYEMAHLQEHVLSKLNTVESITKLRECPDWETMSPEIMRVLLERLTDGSMSKTR